MIDARGRDLGASAALSRDGRFIAVASEIGALWLWDLTYDKVQRLDAGTKQLRAVAFSPDGELVAAGSHDGGVYLFDPATGERRQLLRARSSVIRLEFSPDSAYLVSISPEPTIHLWSVDDGGHHPLAGLSQAALAAAFSADGRRLAGVSVDGELRIWEPGELGSRRLGGRALPQLRGALAPDASFVISGAEDGSIYRWGREEAPPRRLGAHERPIEYVGVADAGDRFVTGDVGGDVKVWSRDGEVLAELPSPIGPALLRAFFLTPDGALVASGGDEHQVRVTELATGEHWTLPTNGLEVHMLAIHPDARRVAVVTRNNVISLWDLRTRTRERELLGHSAAVNSLSFTAGGEAMVSVSIDGELRLWDLASGESRALPITTPILEFSASSDGRVLLTRTTDTNELRLWRDDLPRDQEGFYAWLAGVRRPTLGPPLPAASAAACPSLAPKRENAP